MCHTLSNFSLYLFILWTNRYLVVECRCSSEISSYLWAAVQVDILNSINRQLCALSRVEFTIISACLTLGLAILSPIICLDAPRRLSYPEQRQFMTPTFNISRFSVPAAPLCFAKQLELRSPSVIRWFPSLLKSFTVL